MWRGAWLLVQNLVGLSAAQVAAIIAWITAVFSEGSGPVLGLKKNKFDTIVKNRQLK
jgi:hypothetical protein